MSKLLDKGLDVILEAVDDHVENTYGDWPKDQGIGSSDISGTIRRVIRDLGLEQRELEDFEYDMIRNAVNNTMNKVLNARK